MLEPDFLRLGGIALLLPFVLALICFLVVWWAPKWNWTRVWFGRAGVAVSLLIFVYTLWLIWDLHAGEMAFFKPIDGWQHPVGIPLLPEEVFTLDLHVDALSLYFVLLANLIAFAASWKAAAEMGDTDAANDWNQGTSRLCHPVFLQGCLSGLHLTMLLVLILNNLVAIWIGIELTTLFSALVVGYRNSPAAWEAAWKYLIITSAGIVLALLGTLFLAHAIPEGTSIAGRPLDGLMNWTELMRLAGENRLDIEFVTLAFLFVLIGYGTKAGLAPLHTWLPDGHGEAPAPVSALLSGVLLELALYAILRYHSITNAALGNVQLTSTLLLFAGVLSLLVATPFILKKNPFKRVLAYHSVEHMGIICLGIGFGTPIALIGALLHALNHAATKALMFLAYGAVLHEYRRVLHWLPNERDPDEKVAGVLRALPKTATLLGLGGFALAGTPPFGIFISEVLILWGGMQRLIPGADQTPLPGAAPDWAVALGVAVLMITTTLIFFGLVRHLNEHLLGQPPADKSFFVERWWRDLAPLIVLAVFVVAGVFFVTWSGLLDPCVQILTGGTQGR